MTAEKKGAMLSADEGAWLEIYKETDSLYSKIPTYHHTPLTITLTAINMVNLLFLCISYFLLPLASSQVMNLSTEAIARSRQTTGYLAIPGASLYYETYGLGPLFLFISGANGDANTWRPIAQAISASSNYTVAIYDRRGFSRSYLSSTAAQDYQNRLRVDVNDTSSHSASLTRRASNSPRNQFRCYRSAAITFDIPIHPQSIGRTRASSLDTPPRRQRFDSYSTVCLQHLPHFWRPGRNVAIRTATRRLTESCAWRTIRL